MHPAQKTRPPRPPCPTRDGAKRRQKQIHDAFSCFRVFIFTRKIVCRPLAKQPKPFATNDENMFLRKHENIVKTRKRENMKTVSLLSQKGGTGKTTLCVHLAVVVECAGSPP